MKGIISMVGGMMSKILAFILCIIGSTAYAQNTPATWFLPPLTIDVTQYTSTFADTFTSYDISNLATGNDGLHSPEWWYTGTKQCCMTPTGGALSYMYPAHNAADTAAPADTFTIPQPTPAGLRIRLQKLLNPLRWYSGLIDSNTLPTGGFFSQSYGYYEASMQLPPGPGTWPAFWLLSNDGKSEVDIMENYASDMTGYWFTIHDWTQIYGGDQLVHYWVGTGINLSLAPHRYGFLWTPIYVAAYFDGNLVYFTHTPSNLGTRPHHMLVDLGIGGGFDTTNTPSPSDLLVQYVKAWK